MKRTHLLCVLEDGDDLGITVPGGDVQRGLAKASLDGQVRAQPNKVFNNRRVVIVRCQVEGGASKPVLQIQRGAVLHQRRNGRPFAIHCSNYQRSVTLRKPESWQVEMENGLFR